MGIIYTENSKRLELSIIGYEFEYTPDEITDTAKMWDSNWLTVRIDYTENGQSKTFTDNCLQTFELLSLTESFESVLNGAQTEFVEEFTEENLYFSAEAENGAYKVSVRYSDYGEKASILQTMTRDELRETINKLKELSACFPVKKMCK